MKPKERWAKKIEMRDYRNRKRIAEFKFFIYLLKEKMDSGEVVLTGEAKEIWEHHYKVAAQIS